MEFGKQEPLVKDNKVVSIVVGVMEEDTVYRAYIEKICPIDAGDQKALSAWTSSDLDTFCAARATEYDWQAKLDADIAAQKDEPVASAFSF